MGNAIGFDQRQVLAIERSYGPAFFQLFQVKQPELLENLREANEALQLQKYSQRRPEALSCTYRPSWLLIIPEVAALSTFSPLSWFKKVCQRELGGSCSSQLDCS